jgi:hypothetical protein
VPTPGYSGHTSIFHKPISYLNKDKIMQECDQKVQLDNIDLSALSPSFTKALAEGKIVETEVNLIN